MSEKTKTINQKKSLLVVVLDMTPAFWGICTNEDISLPKCIESILSFANLHLMFSSNNELAIIGVTPEKTKFLWPTATELPKMESDCSYNGQYDLLGRMNDTVRQRSLDLVCGSTSVATNVVLAGGVLKGLCYYLRRCRELQPTKRLDDDGTVPVDIESSDMTERISARILIIKAAADNPSQYLALMNAVFTAQKLHIPIDTCVLPLSWTDTSGSHDSSSNGTTLTRPSSLCQQAAELTGGIYLHIPGAKGLLQYFISVFLPSPSVRPKLLLPDIRSSGLSTGVDFRAACFCHRRLIDMGYVCSVCLSIFCEFSPLCHTCGSLFTVPNVQVQ